MNALNMQFVEPLVRVLEVDGTEITVAPIRVRQLPVLTGLAMPLIDEIVLAPAVVHQFLGSPADADDDARLSFASWLADMVSRHGQAVIDVVALCTGREAAWVGDLLADRLMVLLLLVVEVNADFFGRMLPSLKGFAAGLKLPNKAALASEPALTGQTPSSS